MEQPKQPDRVSFSYGMKLSLPTKYESADFHMSLASDVGETESYFAAFQRVRNQVMVEVSRVYEQIRESETGVLIESEKTTKSESKPTDTRDARRIELPVGDTGGTKEAISPRVRDTKALRQQIKFAFGVLESQRKITKADFVKTYLFGKKTDDLNDLEVTKTIVALREKYPELGV